MLRVASADNLHKWSSSWAVTPHPWSIFAAPLIAALAERGCQVVAMAPDIDDALGEQIRRLGGEPVSISLNRGGLNPAADLASYKALKAEFVRLKPDVLIPYTIKPVIWGTLAARAAGVKAVVPMITGLGFAFTGGVEPRRLISRMMASVLYRLALGKADKVLFQNPDDLATFRSLRLLPGRVPTAIINGSGIDIDHFRPAPLPGEPSFLMIARLLGDKGIREFAAAAARVKKRYPAVPVRLVGFLDQTPDSISQSELDAIIASGVEFLGKMDDVRPAIAGCSVYVLPSYREGTPRSVLEAMAMGRAIITTDAPGCRETVVDGQNGWSGAGEEFGSPGGCHGPVYREPRNGGGYGQALKADCGREVRCERRQCRYHRACRISCLKFCLNKLGLK
jgi:glycosyltransferase involved in cell wall biosynthesis